MIYAMPDTRSPIEQGDLFEACPLFSLEAAEGSDPYEIARWHARVIVLTQSCDLAQAKATRAVVAPVYLPQETITAGSLKEAAIRDQVRRGLMFGWYFLPSGQPAIPMPESVVDFRDLHTLPLKMLADLAAMGKRVARLATPYREHMAQHLGVTYMRIGLPEPYPTAG